MLVGEVEVSPPPEDGREVAVRNKGSNELTFSSPNREEHGVAAVEAAEANPPAETVLNPRVPILATSEPLQGRLEERPEEHRNEQELLMNLV
jgi:hypothetical protein